MSEYLLINILTVIIPFLMSFEKKIQFYRNYIPLFVSIFVVSSVFIVWDIIATYRGDWSFNEDFILGAKLLGLPLEEVLFFITVPYAAIFLYETGKFYYGDKIIAFGKLPLIILAILSIIVGIIYRHQYYTSTIMFFSGFFFIINFFQRTSNIIVNSKLYWIWISFMFLPFLIVNYFLTSLTIVNYSEDAILGIRLATIPIEDFFYSFSMLSFYLTVYLFVKARWIKGKKLQ